MGYVQDIFEQLHRIPEPGFQEVKTSALIEDELKKMGFAVERVAATGLLATLDSGKSGPVLGVRADMDALAYEMDGIIEYRHTCGHDAHSAMVLAAVRTIKGEGIDRGKLVAVFQPAEEILGGAKALIQSGKLSELTDIVGIHIRPNQEGRTGEATAALRHSAAAPVKIRIKGLASHASRPHLGVNAAEAAVLIAHAVSLIHADPNVAHSIKVTKINTGDGAGNVIPDSASVYIDVRAQNNEVMETIIEKLRAAISQSVKAIGAEVEYQIDFCPAAEFSEETVEINRKAICDVLGEEGLLPEILTPGSEDFHFFAKELGVRAGYIGLGADVTPGLHHPDMTFDRKALDFGRRILEQVIRYHLQER